MSTMSSWDLQLWNGQQNFDYEPMCMARQEDPDDVFWEHLRELNRHRYGYYGDSPPLHELAAAYGWQIGPEEGALVVGRRYGRREAEERARRERHALEDGRLLEQMREREREAVRYITGGRPMRPMIEGPESRPSTPRRNSRQERSRLQITAGPSRPDSPGSSCALSPRNRHSRRASQIQRPYEYEEPCEPSVANAGQRPLMLTWSDDGSQSGSEGSDARTWSME